MNLRGFCHGIGLALIWITPLVAQTQNDFSQGYSLKPVALSLGGAFRALADTNAAILLNPAGISQKKGMIAVSGDYTHSGLTQSDIYGISIVDYKASQLVAIGVEYDRDQPSFAGTKVTAQQVTIAVAKEFGSIFNVGISGKYYNSTVATPFVSGPDGGDLDIGILLKPLPMLAFALTGHNLVRGHRFPEFPLQMGMGAALALQPIARLTFELVKDFATPLTNKMNASFGGEFRLAEGMYLRGGFGIDQVRQNNFYSVGAATLGPKVAFTFAFSQRLDPVNETYALNLEFYF